MSKTAIVVFSDPESGGEEALGRLFNAMFLALELKEKRQEVALIFQGAGARWPAEVTKPTHPAHTLYHVVADKVAGVCGGCADVFGAAEGAKAAGMTLVREREIPGTSGILPRLSPRHLLSAKSIKRRATATLSAASPTTTTTLRCSRSCLRFALKP